MEEKFENFMREGTELLELIRHAHALAIAKEESANQRIKLIQWIIVVILAPTLLTSGANSVKNARQLDVDQVYETFATKKGVFELEKDAFNITQEQIEAAARGEIIDVDGDKHRALERFIGDTSRGGNK